MRRLAAVISALVFLAIFCGAGFASPSEPVYAGLTEASAASAEAPSCRVLNGARLRRAPDTALFSLVLSVPASEISVDTSCESCGPESFAVEDDGRIALLDSIGSRICVYGFGGLVRTVPIPCSAYPVRLRRDPSAWFVLDSSGREFRVDKNDKSVRRASVHRASNRSPAAAGSNVFLGCDARGNSYFTSYESIDGPVLLGELVLTRYDRKGQPTGYAVLRTEEYDFVPQNGIFVSEDGRVYVLAVINGSVNVFSVVLGKSYTPHKDDLEARAAYVLRGLPVPKRAVECERLVLGGAFLSPVPVFLPSAPSLLISFSCENGPVPINYEDPFCRIFFRVILQAPG